MNSNNNSEAPATFHETQRFRQAWIAGLIVPVTVFANGLMCWGLYQQVVEGRPWGNNPVPTPALAAIALFIFIITGGITLALFLMKLETRLTPEGLHVTLTFLVDRTIKLDEIAEFAPRTYRPIAEFGGWGKRWNVQGDMAYNAMGNEGVQLVLKNGKKVLIGSQRPAELDRALREALAQP